MAQCTNRYLALCTIPARMSRDGIAGPNAHIWLPFAGDQQLYYFSGATAVFPGSTVPQDNRPYIGGLSQPPTFRKEGAYANGVI